MSKIKITEQELLDGLTAYTAHADELSETDREEWTAMLKQAESILLNEDDYNRLLEVLERPPRALEALKMVFEKKPPWEN